MFSQQELEERINSANEAFVTGDEIPNAPPDPNAKPEETVEIGTGKPVDIYKMRESARLEDAKKQYPKGSPQLVKAVTKCIIDGDSGAEGLARAHKRAEDDSEALLARGDKERAQMVQRQYMEEKFLPAIEAVINYSSPDELLNCKEALAALDSLAMGLGQMKGYTASYVRQAYGNQLGQKEGKSDPKVASTVQKIKMLADSDEIRTAIGLAQKIKKQIDNGEHLASDEDYELIGRVVSYAN